MVKFGGCDGEDCRRLRGPLGVSPGATRFVTVALDCLPRELGISANILRSVVRTFLTACAARTLRGGFNG